MSLLLLKWGLPVYATPTDRLRVYSSSRVWNDCNYPDVLVQLAHGGQGLPLYTEYCRLLLQLPCS